MSVKVTGQKELLEALEERYGQQRLQRVSDRALLKGAQVFVRELKRQFETFKDQGYSIEEITIANPIWLSGKRIVRIHWRGPHDRYRIIHLNEWGTVDNPYPKGKGAVARAMRNAEKPYQAAITKAIKDGL